MTEQMTEGGLYAKFHVFRADWQPVQQFCFVLVPENDEAAQDALFTYALQTPDNALRDDLLELLVEREWCKAEAEKAGGDAQG